MTSSAATAAKATAPSPAQPQNLRPQFPPGFVWGTATAAYQIEGAVREDGRRPSIWDTFCERDGTVNNGDSGAVACDHYHRMPEDVALMASLNVNSYRFSTAWPRVRPDGGAVNPKGVDFYARLVDELLARDIAPWITLYHWDLPQALEDAGGWTSRDTAYRFADYALSLHDALGDRVPTWTTLNEPWCAAFLGYTSGGHAPGRQEGAGGLVAAHHLLLGHGLVVDELRRRGVTSGLGITLNLTVADPFDPDDHADRDAARRIDALHNRVFLDPVLLGRYPEDLLTDTASLVWRGKAWTDAIHDGDLEVMGTPLDLLGVNYYKGDAISGRHHDDVTEFAGTHPGPHVSPFPGCEEVTSPSRGLPRTDMGWEVQPSGLKRLLLRLHQDYPVPPIYITENGAAYRDEVESPNRVHDPERIVYLHDHLQNLHEAMVAGVDVRGFFQWSLLDNFEWAYGYSKRFGMFYVDYDTQARILKDSGRYFAQVAKTGQLPPLSEHLGRPAVGPKAPGDLCEVDDLELTSRAREGDQPAVVELWKRHFPAALSTARRVARQPRDAEELAADAFSGMLAALSTGGGPTDSVRAYLLTSVRNGVTTRARRADATDVLTDVNAVLENAADVPFDPVGTAGELSLMREAFATLPERWRHVLWRTAVDRDSNILVAEELGITPNAVAARAKRARQGLRAAYLQVHVSRGTVDPQCVPYIGGLAALLSDTGGNSATAEHVRDCARCTERLAELRRVDRNLAGFLTPAVLALAPGGIAVNAVTGGAGAGTGSSASSLGSKWVSLVSAAAVGVAGVLAWGLWPQPAAAPMPGVASTPVMAITTGAPAAPPVTTRPPAATTSAPREVSARPAPKPHVVLPPAPAQTVAPSTTTVPPPHSSKTAPVDHPSVVPSTGGLTSAPLDQITASGQQPVRPSVPVGVSLTGSTGPWQGAPETRPPTPAEPPRHTHGAGRAPSRPRGHKDPAAVSKPPLRLPSSPAPTRRPHHPRPDPKGVEPPRRQRPGP